MKKLIFSIFLFALVISPTPSEAEPTDTFVEPELTLLDNGVEISKYQLPDGSVMRVTANVDSSILLAASDNELAQMGIPPRPTIESELTEWLQMYSHANSSRPEALEIPAEVIPNYATYLDSWGGYIAGTFGVVNTSYVAVKSNFTVPTATESCTANPSIVAGFWIGLGGVSSLSNDLVQQGIGWCSLKTINRWVPWTEFAMSQRPMAFCGYSSWYFDAGDVIYNNMSYQNSSDTAYFYMQNQTTGDAHSCSRSAPTGWTFNGNVAECISERVPGWPLADYGSVRFTNCQVELGSNSTWYPIGARSSVKQIITGNPTKGLIYQSTSVLGADDKSFTMTFIRH